MIATDPRQHHGAHYTQINVDQELSALGLCNLIGSCFGGFAAVSKSRPFWPSTTHAHPTPSPPPPTPILNLPTTPTAGFARASVNYEAGGRTQVSAIFASIIVIVCVQWLAPLFYYIPMSGLAALLCGSLMSALDFKPYFEAYRCSKRDFFVLISTAIIMLGVGIDTGIYCGIAISICSLLLKYSYPDLKPLGALPHIPTLSPVRPSSHIANQRARIHTRP